MNFISIKLFVYKSQEQMADKAAQLILNSIKQNPSIKIGFATGSSPLSTYKKLIEDYQLNKTDWSKVTGFNLDEYVGLSEDNPQSYKFFMKENLFNHINIDINNTFIPNGLKKTEQEAARYEKLINEHGGIDLQILGVGTNGHIAFNEPGQPFDSITHIADLTPSTIKANSRFFKSSSEVPKQAFTMGIGTILKAKKILLIAFGEEKALAIKHLLELQMDPQWTCTALQEHNDVTVIIDTHAAKELKKSLRLKVFNRATYNY